MTLDDARFLLAMPHLPGLTPEQLHELVTAHAQLTAEAYERGRAAPLVAAVDDQLATSVDRAVASGGASFQADPSEVERVAQGLRGLGLHMLASRIVMHARSGDW